MSKPLVPIVLFLVLVTSVVIPMFAFAQKQPLRHVVVFKYKPGAPADQIQQVTQAFRALQKTIPGHYRLRGWHQQQPGRQEPRVHACLRPHIRERCGARRVPATSGAQEIRGSPGQARHRRGRLRRGLRSGQLTVRMRSVLIALLLLTCSNIFMTIAWYAHLRELSMKPWYIAVVVSWGIAFFEYVLQVPANRIGFRTLDLAQLKIVQEVITLTVFVPFAALYMKQPLKLDFLWAGLCLLGAVYFMFRS